MNSPQKILSSTIFAFVLIETIKEGYEKDHRVSKTLFKMLDKLDKRCILVAQNNRQIKSRQIDQIEKKVEILRQEHLTCALPVPVFTSFIIALLNDCLACKKNKAIRNVLYSVEGIQRYFDKDFNREKDYDKSWEIYLKWMELTN